MIGRRVVTGHTPDGKAIIAADDAVSAMPFGPSGSEVHLLWGRDDTASFPDDGSQPPIKDAFPPIAGCRASVISIAPGGTEEFNMMVSTALAKYAEPDEPGMHRTASLDFDIVLSGQVVLELDDGVEVVLTAGDVVVQNGTRHRWHNRGSEPAVYASVVVGASNALVAE
jgi:quercetin dioxygenase-like cupin family protein